MKATRGEQMLLPTHRRGGRQRGAGRPRKRDSGVAHRLRPQHSRHNPLHVTLRVIAGLGSLRHRRVRKAVFGALAGGADRFGFRLVHFSVQSNHLHLLCEAEDRRSLGRGMQGLSIRLAKAINRRLGRDGRVFADRYHARALRKPREVRNAICYVLQNARRHASVAERATLPPRWIDPCSSALLFDGWSAGEVVSEQGATADLRAPDGSPITVAARSWLLSTGWKRYGCLQPTEVPGPHATSRVP